MSNRILAAPIPPVPPLNLSLASSSSLHSDSAIVNIAPSPIKDSHKDIHNKKKPKDPNEFKVPLSNPIHTLGTDTILNPSSFPSSPVRIQLPLYRRKLPPIKGFKLIKLWPNYKETNKDLGGERKVERKGGESYTVNSSSTPLSPPSVASSTSSSPPPSLDSMDWSTKFRYAKITIHPIHPIPQSSIRWLIVYFLAFFIPFILTYLLLSFLSCYATNFMTLIFLILFFGLCCIIFGGFYQGGIGPLHCYSRVNEEEEEVLDDATFEERKHETRLLYLQRMHQTSLIQNQNNGGIHHKFFPARAPLFVWITLALTLLQVLFLGQLLQNPINTLCLLSSSISVNESPSYSGFIASDVVNQGMTREINAGATVSTRSFFKFHDGFIETRLARALNITDSFSADGTPLITIYDPLVTDAPSRMLVLAPVWANVYDPFSYISVPVWAYGEFNWIVNGDGEVIAEPESSLKFVSAWSKDYRFGYTMNSFKPEFSFYQQLITGILTVDNMEQFIGAPIISWEDSSSLSSSLHNEMLWILVLSSILFVLLWFGLMIWHIRWYKGMMIEEEEWEKKINKRGPSSVRQVMASSGSQKDLNKFNLEEEEEEGNNNNNENSDESKQIQQEIEMGTLDTAGRSKVVFHTHEDETYIAPPPQALSQNQQQYPPPPPPLSRSNSLSSNQNTLTTLGSQLHLLSTNPNSSSIRPSSASFIPSLSMSRNSAGGLINRSSPRKSSFSVTQQQPTKILNSSNTSSTNPSPRYSPRNLNGKQEDKEQEEDDDENDIEQMNA